MMMCLRASLNDPMTFQSPKAPSSVGHQPNNIQRTSALTCGPVFVGVQRHISHERLRHVAIFLFLKYASSAVCQSDYARQKKKKGNSNEAFCDFAPGLF